MSYSKAIGAWKGIKDGAATAAALLIGGALAALVQVESQCPELTIVAFGFPIGVKVAISVLANYKKHRND